MPLRCAGVLGEDVEDHRGAVQGGAPQQPLQIELLGRAEFVVEHHRVAVHALGQGPDLVSLALAHEGGGVGGSPALADPLDSIRAGGVHEQAQLVKGRFRGGGVPTRPDHADQHDPLPEGPINETGAVAAELAKPAPVRVGLAGAGALDVACVLGAVGARGLAVGLEVARLLGFAGALGSVVCPVAALASRVVAPRRRPCRVSH